MKLIETTERLDEITRYLSENIDPRVSAAYRDYRTTFNTVYRHRCFSRRREAQMNLDPRVHDSYKRLVHVFEESSRRAHRRRSVQFGDPVFIPLPRVTVSKTDRSLEKVFSQVAYTPDLRMAHS